VSQFDRMFCGGVISCIVARLHGFRIASCSLSVGVFIWAERSLAMLSGARRAVMLPRNRRGHKPSQQLMRPCRLRQEAVDGKAQKSECVVYEALGLRTRQTLNTLTAMLVTSSISASAMQACSPPSLQNSGGAGSLAAGMKALWTSYASACETTPIVSKACTSGVVYWVGDVLSQMWERREPSTLMRALNSNSLQSLRSAAIGFFLHGPCSHVWFLTADTIVGPSTSALGIVAKIGLDQTLWSALWNSIFFVSVSLLRLVGLWETLRALPNTTVDLVTAGWKLWLPAHLGAAPLNPCPTSSSCSTTQL
jgi:hypothetical protein